ncbi:iron chelate uptake ABC transporter family permease subunit [Streptomyces spongiicola]|uniref:iron chelate uptake ABC transporter family permease subunit n=1 Tax=Streptomyces spongiicola TaxID=1690221 RepID=UPI0021CF6226|nr:iron chelate uptake ABC transporter family permease subunit [Streptomyces spongiicola]
MATCSNDFSASRSSARGEHDPGHPHVAPRIDAVAVRALLHDLHGSLQDSYFQGPPLPGRRRTGPGREFRPTRAASAPATAPLACSTAHSILGLAVPHLTRVALGTSDHRALIPASMLAGAFLALACAPLSQPPDTDSVLPLNAITSLFGAPVVIAFLIRSRRGVQGVAS